jgi:hypothetical protein
LTYDIEKHRKDRVSFSVVPEKSPYIVCLCYFCFAWWSTSESITVVRCMQYFFVL